MENNATPRRSPQSLFSRPGKFLSHIGGRTMAVARSDDATGNLTRKRLTRKPLEPTAGAPAATATATAAMPPPLLRATGGLRLDDLYRLPMPKLFAQAEREGIVEHTG